MTVEATILPTSGRRQAAVALMIATAMQALDATIANVALPQLEESLGGGIDLGSWVMTSYLCASAVMATLTGWFRRRYGTMLPCPHHVLIDPIQAGPGCGSRDHPAFGASNSSRHIPETEARA